MHAIELKNLTKSFGEITSYRNINLSITKGEVHSILGENGAGKSTLMKTIYGEFAPDAGGEIYINQKSVRFKSPTDAIALGIGMVHQHFRLVRPFTILQNIILGNEPKNIFGIIDYKKAREMVSAILTQYNFKLDLDQKIEDVSVGTQQRVEIIKTLYRNANIIILDEPTAVLTPQEIIEFYEIVKNLKSQGKTILVITHKLHEIKEIADRCTIIRKGDFIETVNVQNVSEADLACKMVGKAVSLTTKKSASKKDGKIILDIKKLNVQKTKTKLALKDFNLTLKAGQITGLAGIDGNGQSELVKTIYGLKKAKSGEIFLNGENILNLSPLEIYERKLSVIPEDRQRVGLVIDFKVKENFVLQQIDKKPFSHYGLIIDREIKNFSKSLIERFDVRPTDDELNASSLSGGNQQKIILAREIAHNPDVLIAFQPTRGLDVGAIEYIHKELIALRDQGKAVLLISYELDEILNLSDHIAIIHDGQIIAEIAEEEIQTNQQIKGKIGLYMAGGVHK